MYIGWITNSYGRLIRFLFILLNLSSSQEYIEHKLLLKKIARTIWWFPEKDSFPHITMILEELGLKITKNPIIGKLYFLLSKFEADVTMSTDLPKFVEDYFFSKFRGPFNKIMEGTEDSVLRDPGVSSLSLQAFLDDPKEIVLFCIRDGIWSRDNDRLNNSSIYYDVLENRNSNSDLFFAGIESLCEKGIRVVRMGRHQQAMNFSHPLFFDYSTSLFANDQNDLLLWKRASWAASTGFGADEWSILFNTPVLYLNFGEAVNRDIRGALDKSRVYLPKIVLLASKLDILNIEELDAMGYFEKYVHMNMITLGKWDVRLIDNSPSVIAQAIDTFRNYIRVGRMEGIVEIEGRKIICDWKNYSAPSRPIDK